MKKKVNFWKKIRVSVLTLALMPMASSIYAEPQYPGDFSDLYPGSQTLNNASSCSVCHDISTRRLNTYGQALCDLNGSIGSRMIAIEDNDPDGDGSSNLTEINENTQPGWTVGNGNELFDRGSCNSDNRFEAAAANVRGDLDPVLANNTAPVAVDDTDNTDVGSSVKIDVLANDKDVDGDNLEVAQVIVLVDTNGNVTNNAKDVTYTPDSNFCGNASFQYQASDGTDVSGNATVNVAVGDSNAPVITGPPNLTIDLPDGVFQVADNNPEIVAWIGLVTAIDAEDGLVDISHDAPANFNVGVTEVIFSATDSCGNTATVKGRVTIQAAGNNIPVITAPDPDPLVLEVPRCEVSLSKNDVAISSWLELAIAEDLEDGKLKVSNNAPNNFTIGDTLVTFSAIDSLKAAGVSSATVTLNASVDSVTTVNAPDPIRINVAAGVNRVSKKERVIAAFLAEATGTDSEDGDLVVSNNAPNNFRLGITIVIFEVTNACGLSETAESTVTITQDVAGNDDDDRDDDDDDDDDRDDDDRRAPLVSFLSPSQGITSSNISVQVKASDSDGIKNVELFINGQFVRRESRSPYEWGGENALSNLSPGNYTLKAIATDRDGDSTSATRKITVQDSSNSGNSGNSGNDSSTEANAVCFFEKRDFRKGKHCFNKGDRVNDLRGLKNEFGSVKVKSGFEVLICDFENLRACTRIRRSFSDLSDIEFSNGDDARNDIASFYIFK